MRRTVQWPDGKKICATFTVAFEAYLRGGHHKTTEVEGVNMVAVSHANYGSSGTPSTKVPVFCVRYINSLFLRCCGPSFTTAARREPTFNSSSSASRAVVPSSCRLR